MVINYQSLSEGPVVESWEGINRRSEVGVFVMDVGSYFLIRLQGAEGTADGSADTIEEARLEMRNVRGQMEDLGYETLTR